MRHCSFVVNFERKTATAHIQALWAMRLGQFDKFILMKISLGKRIAIGAMVFTYGMIILTINLSDDLRITRHELTRFYSTKMDSCAITRIDTLKYPGGRGTYQIFYTECNPDFYPILFENGNRSVLNINSKIIKKANSTEFRLLKGDKFYDSKMRHPDNEDDRAFKTIVVSIFISILTVLILLTPNSKFEKIEQ